MSAVTEAKQLTKDELEAGLDHIRLSPRDEGRLDLIVCRPRTEERALISEGELDVAAGLIGDNWSTRGSRTMPDGSCNPDMQINVMNSRVVALVAHEPDRWPLAGDQLFLDLDLSDENLPAGTQLSIGSAIIEVTPPPHLGCQKFIARFGMEAMKFVNSPLGKSLRLRGLNAKVVKTGVIKVGDVARKMGRSQI